jgi:WD40 repeat protein
MYIPVLLLEKELDVPGFADYERGQLEDLRWSSCGRFIAGITSSQCRGENSALVWEFETGKIVRSFLDEIETASAAWAPGKPVLALVCYNYSHPDKSRVRLYNPLLNRLDTVRQNVQGITHGAVPTWSCDSRYIAVSGGEGTVTVIDADVRSVIHQTGSGNYGFFLWSPDRPAGALCGTDGIEIFYLEGNAVSTYRIGIPNGAARMAWSPDGACMASLSRKGEIAILDSREGSLLWQYEELLPISHGKQESRCVPKPVSLMAWSPCGSELYVSGGGREIVVISAEKRTLLARLTCLSSAVSISISSDGEWVAVRSEAQYGERGQIEIWRRGSWQHPILKPLSGMRVKYPEHSRALEFHPGEPLLASFNNGSWHISVWRVGTRKMVTDSFINK